MYSENVVGNEINSILNEYIKKIKLLALDKNSSDGAGNFIDFLKFRAYDSMTGVYHQMETLSTDLVIATINRLSNDEVKFLIKELIKGTLFWEYRLTYALDFYKNCKEDLKNDFDFLIEILNLIKERSALSNDPADKYLIYAFIHESGRFKVPEELEIYLEINNL